MKIREQGKRQRGVALLLAIFALLLLSGIGLAMLFSTDTETSISINYRDKQAAIYGAMAGLQEARDRIHPLTGDLGVGTNLSAGGLNIVPTALPSTSAPNVLYLINPAPGETVAPWDPTNKYFDTELCQESYFVNNLGVTPGTPGQPCSPTAPNPVPTGNWYTWYDNSQKQTKLGATGTGDAALVETAYQLKDSGGNKIPLTYKWVRIMLKADNMTPVTVGTGGGRQACWDGSHEKQMPVGYHTDCTPPADAVTNIAVTASGSGYTSAPTVAILPPVCSPGPDCVQATAIADVGPLPVGITSVTLTDPVTGLPAATSGAGYTTPPAVTVGGDGTGAVVNATLNSILPVGSVNWTSSPPACFAIGSSPSLSFNPAGATASTTMTGQSCVYSIAVSGKCSDGTPSTVTASGGFSGSVTWGGPPYTASGTSVTNPGNYPSSLPGSSAFTVNCSNPGSGNNVPKVTPTYGIQINTISVTSGGAYQAGNPPSVSFVGATPKGGSPTATATLSGASIPGPVTNLFIPFGGNGSGYTVNPVPLTIAPPSCTPGPTCIQATGTASITPSNGVTGIRVLDGGRGYSPASPPAVTLIGGGYSSLATAMASVGSGGSYQGAVYLLTSLAVMPSGARAMAQMEAGVNYDQFTLGLGGALTLIGPNPSFGTPNSNPFHMIGNDCPTCAPIRPGCDTTPNPAMDSIGVYDPTNATNPSAVQTVINDLGKPNNYIGANSSPDVHNANLGSVTASELTSFVNNSVIPFATGKYCLAGSAVCASHPDYTQYTTNPTINLGSAANPATNVVYGDYTMGPQTGYGTLVVTGTLTISGNYSWNGLIFVIGAGASIMNGGGTGQINGAVYVANTAGGTLSSPVADWSGGGGNGIQYDHCWADDLLKNFPAVPSVSPSALQVISLRNQVY